MKLGISNIIPDIASLPGSPGPTPGSFEIVTELGVNMVTELGNELITE